MIELEMGILGDLESTNLSVNDENLNQPEQHPQPNQIIQTNQSSIICENPYYPVVESEEARSKIDRKCKKTKRSSH